MKAVTGKPWKGGEDTILATFWTRKAAKSTIMRKLPGRSWRAIEYRAYRLCLPTRTGRKAQPRAPQSQKDQPKAPPVLPPPAVPPSEERRRARARQLAEVLGTGAQPTWLLHSRGWLAELRHTLEESGEWFVEADGCVALSAEGRQEFYPGTKAGKARLGSKMPSRRAM